MYLNRNIMALCVNRCNLWMRDVMSTAWKHLMVNLGGGKPLQLIVLVI